MPCAALATTHRDDSYTSSALTVVCNEVGHCQVEQISADRDLWVANCKFLSISCGVAIWLGRPLSASAGDRRPTGRSGRRACRGRGIGARQAATSDPQPFPEAVTRDSHILRPALMPPYGRDSPDWRQSHTGWTVCSQLSVKAFARLVRAFDDIDGVRRPLTRGRGRRTPRVRAGSVSLSRAGR